ncbi:MAG TPA: tetratricopeptide repeat protein, partial [Candidatus Angelobacter sp.]|nr:tetratricopeptide repeat protein [Candidatus Angelobacter sp.]
LCRRALAIQEKVLGPNHPDVAASLNNLAMLLFFKADYAGAEQLLQRALAINESALGTNHPATRNVRDNLTALRQRPK